MVKVRNITPKDMEDLLAFDWTRYDALRATATMAKHILEAAEAAEADPNPHAPQRLRNFNPPPPLPETFRAAIRRMAGGKAVAPPKLVIQKRLFDTDVSSNNNRLSIPFFQTVSKDFLTEEEKSCLSSYDESGKNKKSLDVKVVGPAAAEEAVVAKFTKWESTNSSFSYVINGAWKDIVKKNGLRKNMEVQLWSFRIDEGLCFALVRLS